MEEKPRCGFGWGWGTSRTEHALMRIKLCLNLVHVVFTEGYRLTSGTDTRSKWLKTLCTGASRRRRGLSLSLTKVRWGEKSSVWRREGSTCSLSFFSRTCSQGRTQESLLQQGRVWKFHWITVKKNRIYCQNCPQFDHNSDLGRKRNFNPTRSIMRGTICL